PRISFSSASLSWPYPCPPSSGPRWVAHNPFRRTSSFSGSITLRRLSSSGTNCRCGNARSSGSSSSRTNSSAQSRSFRYSGSVSKSHDIAGLLSIERDDDLVGCAGRRGGLQRLHDVVEGDRVADDHRIFFPVGDQFFGDFEDCDGEPPIEMKSVSVPQIPHTRILTSTSAGPTVGLRRVDHLCLTGCCHHRHLHVCSST